VGARPEGPVVTARTGRPPLAAADPIPEADGVQRIVVGVDGSAASRAALRRAADLAQDLGAELDVVQAWQYPPALHDWDAVPSNYGYLPMAPPVERVEQDARDDLAATVADVLGSDPVVTVTQRVVEGHPARVVMEAAKGATFLVVGRRGHGGLAGLLLGSVARACSEHAACPVVIVPRPHAAGGVRPDVPAAEAGTPAS
jgi:nucleotide-binding universal stress UspA family protein